MIIETTSASAMRTASRRLPRGPANAAVWLFTVPFIAIPAAGLLFGCSSTSSVARGDYDPRLDLPRTVSAREYGYVRPATDIQVIGRDTDRHGRSVSGGHTSADLWDRVRRGPSLGIASHARVDRAVRSLRRDPAYLTGLTKRARPYLHVIVGELERAGLPAELALLPEVESRYNPRAVSPVSASGMWQFMPYTGTEMGLVQNGWYDGRNDILASTRGAIAYLTQLHAEFNGDWALALASYNAGPARVRAAQRANKARGRPTDFWSLNLPNETELYVPKLLAIVNLVREPARHGMQMPPVANRPTLELVEARGQINLAYAARQCGVPLRTLRDLNPGLKRGVTPRAGPHRVLVPLGTGHKLRRALAKSGELGAPKVAGGSGRRRNDS